MALALTGGGDGPGPGGAGFGGGGGGGGGGGQCVIPASLRDVQFAKSSLYQSDPQLNPWTDVVVASSSRKAFSVASP